MVVLSCDLSLRVISDIKSEGKQVACRRVGAKIAYSHVSCMYEAYTRGYNERVVG